MQYHQKLNSKMDGIDISSELQWINILPKKINGVVKDYSFQLLFIKTFFYFCKRLYNKNYFE